jgi:diguanylate cyclase (GGDEF)-like protein/PAS domain S-box-containing protein
MREANNMITSSILLKHIYDSATDFAIFTLELDGTVSSWNAGSEKIFGISEAEIVGDSGFQIFTQEDRDRDIPQQEMRTAASAGRAADYRWHMRRDGTRFWADGVMSPIRNENNDIIGYLKILQDITDRKIEQDEIIRLGAIDPLTGLSNRAWFDARTHEMVMLCARGDHALQLLMIDLDRFKEVNDTLGHQAGDELLRQVARRLRDVSRESDILGRLGGDEFALLQVGPNDLSAGGVLASKIVATLAAPFKIYGAEVNISASVGIASCPNDSTDPEILFKQADLALYKAKGAGKNGFHLFTDELDKAAHKRNSDNEELKKIVATGKFTLAYQPIVDCNTRRATAMEALVRFPGPILSTYSVDYVVNLAQELGLIFQIGAEVFREACKQLRRWQDAGIQDLKICINTCAKELSNEGYFDAIESAMAESGIGAHDIEIELTERDVIMLKSSRSDVLDVLVASGFNLSLDDFGTGYSSLSYLRTLPVSTIKLDKSFLIGIPDDPEANAVAKAVVTLANDLKLKVIAEGVEEKQQMQFLQQIDCATLQGFLFSQAMPPAHATEWLFLNRSAGNTAPANG